VVATAEVRGHVTEANAAWTLSPRLASGGAGFKTVVSDATAVAGQTVTVKSIARDGNGNPVPNILVTWVWDLGDTKVRSKAYTDERGRARTARTITAGMAREIDVEARTQSGSTNRTSAVVIRRVD